MSLPRYLSAEDLTGPLKLGKPAVYELMNRLPKGVVVRLGRKIRVDEDAFKAWLAAGGTL